MQKWQCRIAPTLGGGFAGTPNDVWGTVDYTNDTDPTVFFGMYGLNDYQAWWNHKGEKAILWAGSDMRNYLNGYWLDREGKDRIKPAFYAGAKHYVENSLEQIALGSMGHWATVVPSFLGNVEDYPIQEIDPRPRYYTSVSGDDFELYGWNEIDDIAKKNPDTEYHLYGNTKPWTTTQKNVFVHGRLTQEEMDGQIKSMTGAIRLTRFDGFSEILAKSILWGQKPISPYIYYPFLHDRKQFLEVVNKYPWNVKVN